MARVTPDAARQGRFAARFAQQAGGITCERSLVATLPHVTRGDTITAPASSPGSDRSSGRTPIPTSSTTRSGRTAMTTAIGPMPMTTSSTACSGASRRARRLRLRTAIRLARIVRWRRAQRVSSAPRASYASVQELCRQPGSGVTAWPFGDIERKVGLNGEQKQLLDEVRRAGRTRPRPSRPRARRTMLSR